MNSYALTKRAEADLLDIVPIGYEQFGEQQAHAYAAELDHVFQLLADNPRMGREVETIGRGVRRHEHAAHVILYEIAAKGVLILTIVHTRSIKRLAL